MVGPEECRRCLQPGRLNRVEFVEPSFGPLNLLVDWATTDRACARVVPDQLQLPYVLDDVPLAPPARVWSGVPDLRWPPLEPALLLWLPSVWRRMSFSLEWPTLP